MNNYITDRGMKYLIRGPYTAAQIRTLYAAFVAKYPTTKTTFREWLNRGKVYNRHA